MSKILGKIMKIDNLNNNIIKIYVKCVQNKYILDARYYQMSLVDHDFFLSVYILKSFIFRGTKICNISVVQNNLFASTKSIIHAKTMLRTHPLHTRPKSNMLISRVSQDCAYSFHNISIAPAVGRKYSLFFAVKLFTAYFTIFALFNIYAKL